MFIFVSDVFVDKYVGGAELSTEGLIEFSDCPILKIEADKVTPEIMDSLSHYHWVFTNTSYMDKPCYIKAIKSLNYSVVEYDYKFCSLRSIEKHTSMEGKCSCENSSFGKLFSVFLAKAKSSFFMSSKQRDKYFDRFPFLRKENTHVLSSIFSPDVLQQIDNLNNNLEKTEEEYLIVQSSSWVKGVEQTIEHAKNNDIKHKIVGGLKYGDLLAELRKHKGLIFMPAGSDTCPRLVIEAALLGCDVIVNENVQHTEEDWWVNKDRETMVEYLSGRAEYFWEEVYRSSPSNSLIPKKSESQDQKYIFIVPAYNAQEWIGKTIETVKKQNCKNFECYIGDDISIDNTFEVCNKVTSGDSRFHVVKNKEKKYALKNINDLIDLANPHPEDVIVILDGDDWLSSKYVLDTLNSYYGRGALATYGSFMEYPTGKVGMESSKYPDEVIDQNSYRSDTWRASHLKTLKYKVWKDINKEDFVNREGDFYDSSYDQAIMLPALEMCGHKAMYVPEVLYVYNLGNPNAVVKDRQQKQYENMLEIRAKSKYTKKEYS